MADTAELNGLEIAIVGMAGKFPGANNIEEFWKNLENGVESVSFLTDEELVKSKVNPELFNNPKYVKAAYLLDDIEKCDPAFFGLTPREAESMDPQLRIFLECSWEALEDSGYDPFQYDGKIGLFSSCGISTYLLRNIMSAYDLRSSNQIRQIWLGNDPNFVSTYTSYKYNLRGPSFNIQTACSSSLVGTHLACQSLIDFQSDIALVGGVKVTVPHKEGYLFQEGEVLSPDGHCKPFDANGKGTLTSNGAGVVVLKRLQEAIDDRDNIYAVIKGSSINNDGSNKVGYSAPSIDGQAEVIAEAQAVSEVDPGSITYIEAHGTATELGDPIEIAALSKAFQSNGVDKKQYCAVGSLKSNMGHLDSAAGIAGLMKVALSLKNKKIVPSLNYSSPNPKIDFASSPFFVNTELKDWERNGLPLRAGVSSFGIGGTNAHAILEEAPVIKNGTVESDASLILLSAKSISSLNALSLKYIDYFENTKESLANIAYTSQVGRAQFYYRRTIVADNVADACNELKNQHKANTVSVFNEKNKKEAIFLFPGQGAQYLNMARQVYETEPEFRETLDYCFAKLKIDTGLDLKKIVFPETDTDELTNQINQTSITQTVLFSIEYALAKLWMSWGVSPAGMIGHSLGEYVAACISGVITLDDALHLIAIRGKLIQELPKGDMLSIFLSEEEIRGLINDNLSIAAINAPGFCVVSGNTDDINELEKNLTDKKISCQKLHTSHAFHSAMMNPILDIFFEEVKKIKLSAPSIPYISNVTGNWINPEEVTDPYYWVKHLRNTVKYADGIQKLLENDNNVFFEIGPGRILSTLTKQNSSSNQRVIITSLPGAKDKTNDYKHLLSSLARTWQSGISIDWNMFNKDKEHRRVSMPTYAFIKNRYWIEPVDSVATSIPSGSELKENLDKIESADYEEEIANLQTYHQRPNLSVEYVAPKTDFESVIATIWQDLIGIDKIGIHDNFYELGGHSLLATQMIARFKEAFSIELTLDKFMEAQTVAEMATIIIEEIGNQFGEENLSLLLDEIDE